MKQSEWLITQRVQKIENWWYLEEENGKEEGNNETRKEHKAETEGRKDPAVTMRMKSLKTNIANL